MMDRIQFYMKVAGVTVRVECRYPYTVDACRNYLIAEEPADVEAADRELAVKEPADIEASVNDQEFKEFQDEFPIYSKGYAEYICIHRCVADQIPFYRGFVFHGAAVSYDGRAYLFTAPSGTGKTTHIWLWRKYLGKRVDIINGDKPILTVNGSGVLVHGTPWAGKENWQKNRSAPLAGICFLERGQENSIARLRPEDCIDRMFHQTYLPRSSEGVVNTMELLDRVMSSVPLYLFRCDISEDAVRTSFEGMTGCHYQGMGHKNQSFRI